MHTVTSPDGTSIAYRRSGDGPALLLIHGATADHSTTWRIVGPMLERRFTVYAMDRRGRDARVIVLPGQQHAAVYTAPELFVREVEGFLGGHA